MGNREAPWIARFTVCILLGVTPAVDPCQCNPRQERKPESVGNNPLGFDTTTMCGPNCLWQIARAYGSPCSLDAIRSMAQTDIQSGTTMMGMIEAARGIGLQAAGVKTNIRALAQDPRVAIMLLNLGENGHYVILDRMQGGNVHLLDGGTFRELSIHQLESVWDGHAVLIGRCANHDPNRFRTYSGVALQGVGWLLLFGLGTLGLCCVWFRMSRWRPSQS